MYLTHAKFPSSRCYKEAKILLQVVFILGQLIVRLATLKSRPKIYVINIFKHIQIHNLEHGPI